MPETVTNLKIKIGADSSQFKKGIDESKKVAQEFKSEAGSAFSSFAALFGVNMNQIKESTSLFKTSLSGIGKAMASSATGATLFTKTLQVLKIAMISTGIGALIVALGSLVAWFKRTEVGGDKLAQIMAAIGAYINVIMDRIAALGQWIVNAFKDPIKAVKEFWHFLTGGGLKDAIKSTSDEIRKETKAAWENADALDKVEDREIALIEVQAKRRLEIEKLRRAAEDQSKSEGERARLLQQAMNLEKQTLEENLSLQKERVRVMQSEYDMGQKTAADTRELNEAKAELYRMESEYLSGTRRMYSKEQTLSTKANKEETQSIREKIQAQDELFNKINEIRSQMIAPFTERQKREIITTTKQETAGPIDTTQLVDMTGFLEEQKGKYERLMSDMRDVTIDIGSQINSAFEGISEGIGESIGNMIAGVGGFNDIGQVILTGLADLAIQVGKIAIGAGVAVLGIKKALESMNPYVAIAAGVALIALGSAVKGALSNAAKGSGSSAITQGGGGTYDSRTFGSGNTSGSRSQSLKIEVVGQTTIRKGDIYIAYKNAENSKKINT